MKKIAVILIFVLSFINGFSQDNLPNSFVNIGVGIGQTSGGLGVKTVIGYRNSGLLIGLGYFGLGLTGYKIGGQISFHNFYAEIGYGLIATSQVNEGPINPIEAGSILIGGMVGIGKAKRIFIDMGVGYSFGAPDLVLPVGVQKMNVMCFNIGLGYRIGNKK